MYLLVSASQNFSGIIYLPLIAAASSRYVHDEAIYVTLLFRGLFLCSTPSPLRLMINER